MKVASEWDTTQVGNVQVDYVEHCGRSTAGDYIHTLSAVDTDTEARILSHLRQARAGRTTIIVSHRLSAVADADQIIVLKEGHVVEQGGHAALLAANGWYARQWRYQQLEASLDAS